MKKFRWVYVWVVFVGLSFVWGQALPERAGYVNDFTGVLSVETTATLEALLNDHEQATGHALHVLIVQDLEGLSLSDYDEQITTNWGLGDQHLLLLIALDEEAIHISVGDALQSIYPDAVLSGVLNDIIPTLALGKFDEGISEGVNQLIGLSAGQGAPRNANPPGLLEGPFRLVLLGGVVALSALLYFLFLA